MNTSIEKMFNKELHNLYSPREGEMDGDVACIGEVRNA
jgi:hypothetical protein